MTRVSVTRTVFQTYSFAMMIMQQVIGLCLYIFFHGITDPSSLHAPKPYAPKRSSMLKNHIKVILLISI